LRQRAAGAALRLNVLRVCGRAGGCSLHHFFIPSTGRDVGGSSRLPVVCLRWFGVPPWLSLGFPGSPLHCALLLPCTLHLSACRTPPPALFCHHIHLCIPAYIPSVASFTTAHTRLFNLLLAARHPHSFLWAHLPTWDAAWLRFFFFFFFFFYDRTCWFSLQRITCPSLRHVRCWRGRRWCVGIHFLYRWAVDISHSMVYSGTWGGALRWCAGGRINLAQRNIPAARILALTRRWNVPHYTLLLVPIHAGLLPCFYSRTFAVTIGRGMARLRRGTLLTLTSCGAALGWDGTGAVFFCTQSARFLRSKVCLHGGSSARMPALTLRIFS